MLRPSSPTVNFPRYRLSTKLRPKPKVETFTVTETCFRDDVDKKVEEITKANGARLLSTSITPVSSRNMMVCCTLTK